MSDPGLLMGAVALGSAICTGGACYKAVRAHVDLARLKTVPESIFEHAFGLTDPMVPPDMAHLLSRLDEK